MTKSELKIKLQKLINSINDVEMLKAIYEILKSKQATNTVAEPQMEYIKKNKLIVARTQAKKMSEKEEDYTKPGKPMSMETFKKRIADAEKRVDRGEFTTQEDLEKEMEKW